MLLICISGKATERNLLLIPYPQQVSIKQGNYNLTDNVKIGADPLFTQELKKLQEVLTEDFGLKSQIVKPSKADISLCYDASFMQEEKEAYQLEVTDMKITIRAQMATGIFYGIQSLRQLIKSEAGKWIIPKLTITDYPALSWRSRKAEPFATLHKWNGTKVTITTASHMADSIPRHKSVVL